MTDAELRRQALDGPPPVWEDLGIDPLDGESLRSIDRHRLEIFSRAILSNRFGRIAESLPRTTLLLGGRAPELFEEFCRSHPPENKIHREGLAFATFLNRSLDDRPEPWYLPDVLAYEAHLLDLRFHFDGDYGAGEAVADPQELLADDGPLDRLVPRKLRHHRLLELGCDIEALLPILDQGVPPAVVEPETCFLLAHIEPRGTCGRLVLSSPLVGLYLAVDGEAAAAALPGNTAAWLGAPELANEAEFRTSCLAALGELASRRVVALERG
ncbi:MAG TPA: hypothetical protein VHQ65_15560 [Thermoanaerobaculia bacterium]|nr:hypothetical protein [Thermoanaerobaculia bacterium]